MAGVKNTAGNRISVSAGVPRLPAVPAGRRVARGPDATAPADTGRPSRPAKGGEAPRPPPGHPRPDRRRAPEETRHDNPPAPAAAARAHPAPPGPGTRQPRPARRPRRPVTALAAAAALTAAAQPALAGTAGHVLAAASIGQVISNITKWIVGILAGLATLFLTLGGLRYLMAGGDPSEVERAKTALRSAAIGYGLAILAPVIVTVLKSLVGG